MNYEELDRLLFEWTALEAKLKDNDLSDDIIKSRILSNPSSVDRRSVRQHPHEAPAPSAAITHPPIYHYTLEGDRLRLHVTGEIFAISRHTRFVKMLKHTHDLFEMNYVYSGTFYQEIEGERFELNEGDLIILNKNVEHSIEKCGENDILINFLAKNEFFDNAFIYNILGDHILGKTIASIIADASREKNFLLFHTSDNWQIRQTIQNLLCESFGSKKTNQEIIKSYMTILFSRLLESDSYEMFLNKAGRTSTIPVIEIMAYINEHYLNATLEQTAKHFRYSAEHLGRIIKNVTGKNFSALVLEQKFMHAALQLKLTDRTVEQISKEIGYNNLSFFYKKFYSFYGVTPMEYRRSAMTDGRR
ncbi:AraC family transcriptional regulator [Paenibacillus sacheonensis]|uniref:Helix-turn-helix domain-containing protein n=1 Tax=Paenibacillus sacheonensis TaxID=742054 RepID=A0A7X4YS20_9BACL|nr:AraC family transcriptional regulator [Paenibacillus sacheonensis]MBM7566273.1 AraC-like DNA-binding protein/mannose-6-phosphate isomerase-like protein (cupin superfamily) [Paenibacillus sacheonensis]NBC70479.1 helix-turn-helix domain-containing protein [Paenibacillus sacheonensis]